MAIAFTYFLMIPVFTTVSTWQVQLSHSDYALKSHTAQGRSDFLYDYQQLSHAASLLFLLQLDQTVKVPHEILPTVRVHNMQLHQGGKSVSSIALTDNVNRWMTVLLSRDYRGSL